MKVETVLSDNGREFCGREESFDCTSSTAWIVPEMPVGSLICCRFASSSLVITASPAAVAVIVAVERSHRVALMLECGKEWCPKNDRTDLAVILV